MDRITIDYTHFYSHYVDRVLLIFKLAQFQKANGPLILFCTPFTLDYKAEVGKINALFQYIC